MENYKLIRKSPPSQKSKKPKIKKRGRWDYILSKMKVGYCVEKMTYNDYQSLRIPAYKMGFKLSVRRLSKTKLDVYCVKKIKVQK